MKIALVAASLVLAGCTTPSLVLLPDDDGGQGAVAVLESKGEASEAVIEEGNSRTRLGNRSPTSRPLGEKGLKERETALIGDLPPPPRSFVLYFEPGTTDLVDRSKGVLAEVRKEIAERSGPDVEVIGHTDTVGSDDDNDRLSQRRAEEVMNWLVSQGFDASIMSAVGRGERELKERTADNVDNGVNRRVEVIVR